jgi:superfamily II DNA or RNA helicase
LTQSAHTAPLDLWSAAAATTKGEAWDGRLARDERAPSFVPRPYQVDARAAVRSMWSTNGPQGQQPMLVQWTATGKTLTSLFIAQDFLAAGQRVVWLADKRELLSQPLADLNRHWPRIRGGIVQASKDVVDAQFVFLSVDTARVEGRTERILEHGYPALIIVDEAHGSLAPKFRKALKKLRGPDTLMLALTATPDRADGGDLSVLWEIAFTFGPTEAIDAGWVVPPYAVVDKLARLDERLAEAHVPVNADGEYDDEALGKALMLAGVVEWTVAAMSKTYKAKRLPFRDDEREMTARGRFPMVFCASVEQCERTCEALRADGWEARFITGTTPDRDRERLLKLFKAGKIECLVNVGTLTTGTDVPISACSVMARPFGSWVLYCQSLGRSSRIYCPGWNPAWGFSNANDPRYAEAGGKRDCFVLDLAGASNTHSIVSAPILIGGSRCPDAEDGVHDYHQATAADGSVGVKGVCSHCGRQISCFASLSSERSKRDGKHEWFDVDPAERPAGLAVAIERACLYCLSPQCTRSPNGKHTWVALDVEQSVICVDCDAEMPYRGDALESLVGKKKGEAPPEADWLRVKRDGADLVPETYACDIDGQGLVIVVGDRTAGSWWPFWVRKGARRARPLASGPVPRDDVRLRCADLLRRVRRGQASRLRNPLGNVTEAQLEYGRQLGVDLSGCKTRGDAAIEITRAHAWQRAVGLGLAKARSEQEIP